MEMKFTLHKIQ